MPLIRGSNPIWFTVDLTAHAFDDTFYLFVLQNELPYLPATVFHDPSGNIPWTQPIQYLANGTLPEDIFWDPDVVYRLEFRHGPTQSDPLIYLVENYRPGQGGNTPIDDITLATENQITNPQFSLVSFNSPFTLTNVTNPDPIEVAPGWFLNLTGTGSVTLTKIPLYGTAGLINPSNAPYALRITLTGTWSATPYLSQRFNQNGMLWADKNVSSAITARIEGAATTIFARIDASDGTPLAIVLDTTTLNGTFNEYTGHGLMPDPKNMNVPPDAWIEYRLFLQSAIDIYVTSFQLIVTDAEVPIEPPFQQDTIERQQDHTFHYYRESLLMQPKDSILTGWDFGLNPWQFFSTSQTNVSTFGYTADQTIIVQQAYVDSATMNNVSVGRGTFAENYGCKVQAVTATNQFAMIQYIDPRDIRPYWANTLSSLVNLTAQKQGPSANLRLKMKLIYRASLPPSLAQNEPILSWTALGEPVFAAGWTALKPINDPVYNLKSGSNTLTFNGFELPTSTNDNMTLAIVIYTLDPMNQAGTPDFLLFNRVSLVPNDFAIDSSILTYNETLRNCQFHYMKSFPIPVLPAHGTGVTTSSFGVQTTASGVAGFGPLVRFPVMMRTSSPVIFLYTPGAGPVSQIETNPPGITWSGSSVSGISEWGFSTQGTPQFGSVVGERCCVHWTANGLLGT